MANRVLSSTSIKTVVNSGRTILVKYATRTDSWARPFLATSIQDDFTLAVEKAPVPPNAAIAIMTETEHPSKKDAYPHYTTVYQDENENHITTKHIYR